MQNIKNKIGMGVLEHISGTIILLENFLYLLDKREVDKGVH